MKTIVTIEKVYSDGSGAPATVLCQGFYFAADFIGEVRLSGLAQRSPSRRVIAAAKKQYLTALRLHIDYSHDWLLKNLRMYSEVAQ